ncbi:hypothetical protein BC830DRAFT_1132436 [Chytriomyces sp. MP71]|nr:hypothetical protein BC830DRAFT_1132436 [Chytriomyces sp. MP71]
MNPFFLGEGNFFAFAFFGLLPFLSFPLDFVTVFPFFFPPLTTGFFVRAGFPGFNPAPCDKLLPEGAPYPAVTFTVEISPGNVIVPVYGNTILPTLAAPFARPTARMPATDPSIETSTTGNVLGTMKPRKMLL